MNFTHTDLYPNPVNLLLRKWFNEDDASSYLVPTIVGGKPVNISHMVAYGLGCGGMGDGYGGGGALAKAKAKATPGEQLLLQVGKVSTASALGDTFVKRANNSVIIYADRGRGNGTPGLASNSTGDIKMDGKPGSGSAILIGAPPSDLEFQKSIGIGGFGFFYAQSLLQAADYGGGGRLIPLYDSEGIFTGSYYSDGAGTGKICIDFLDGDPGAIQ